MNQYNFNGTIMLFNTVVKTGWQASTRAVSEEKAMSNLSYQAKKLLHLTPSAKIKLKGRIEVA